MHPSNIRLSLMPVYIPLSDASRSYANDLSDVPCSLLVNNHLISFRATMGARYRERFATTFAPRESSSRSSCLGTVLKAALFTALTDLVVLLIFTWVGWNVDDDEAVVGPHASTVNPTTRSVRTYATSTPAPMRQRPWHAKVASCSDIRQDCWRSTFLCDDPVSHGQC